MIDSIKRITLDLHDLSSRETVEVKQSDTGRKICISLIDGGMPYHISQECRAEMTAKKPDGNKMSNDCTIEDNVIIYSLTKQLSWVPGLVKCEVKLYGADGKLITSPRFSIMVDDTVCIEGDEFESEEEIRFVESLISDATKAIDEANNAAKNANDVATAVLLAKANGEFKGEKGDPGYTPKKGVDYFDGAKGDKGDPFVYSDFTAAQLAALKGDPGYTPKKNVDYFDGAKGDPGYTPVKGKDYVDGKDGVSATHRWNGTTLTVTSASGTSSADLKGDPGDKGDPGPQGEWGRSMFYSTETFPDAMVGYGRNLSVAAVSLAGRSLKNDDMILTADGLLWQVTNDYVSSTGTIGAKCVSNLRGAADAQGYSIYYSSQILASPIIGSVYHLNYADINLSDRPLTEGDLIVTPDGFLWRVSLSAVNANDNILAICLCNIAGGKGTPGYSIYYSSQILASPKVGGRYSLNLADVNLSDRNLCGGDLIITADGYLWKVYGSYEIFDSDFSADCIGNIKGADGIAKDGTGIHLLKEDAHMLLDHPGNVQATFNFSADQVETNGKTLREGDFLIDKNGLLCSVTYAFDNGDGSAKILFGLKGKSIHYYDGTCDYGNNVSAPGDGDTWYFDYAEYPNIRFGDMILSSLGKLYTVISDPLLQADGDFVVATKCVANLKGAKGDAGSVTSVNGVAPDASGNVEIKTGGVTSVNGVFPDKNGNVEVETGGGMGGADWNAAEGEEGYVRNRTHYHQKQILLPETKVIFGSDGVQDDRADVPFVSLVVGESYAVNWNGREYITQARDISATVGTEAYGLGNLGSLSGINMEETGEPFIMEFVPSFKVGLCMTADGSYGSENTVSIVKETLCKLPGKFLPEGVPYVEKGEEVEITISGEWMEEDPVDRPGEWMYLFTSPIGLKAGNTYIVNWDGTDYECVAFEVDMMGDGSAMAVCLGNASAGGSGMEDTGEPFLMQEVPAEFAAEMGAYGAAASIDYMGNIPFSIKGEDATIHKLDPRCLPDSVGNLYTAVFDVMIASDDSINATAKQSFAEVYAKANDPNTFVRGFMKLKFYDMDAGMKPLYFSGVMKDTFQNPVIEFMALTHSDSNVVCWTVSYYSDGTVTVTGL